MRVLAGRPSPLTRVPVSSVLNDAVTTPTYFGGIYPAVFVYLPTLLGQNLQVSISSSSGAEFYVFAYKNRGQSVIGDEFSYDAYYYSAPDPLVYYKDEELYETKPVGYTFRDFYSSYLSSRDTDTIIVVNPRFTPVLDDLQLVVYDGVFNVGSVILNPPPPRW
jgi:hypothetical protein